MELIKNIQGEVLTNVVGDVIYVKSLSGEIQQEDYVGLNGFIGYLQNLKKAEETAALTIPNPFGLRNQYNKIMVTLEIDY